MAGTDSTPDSGTDRGQAYTLEGFIGSVVVLMALLFAIQSVVITPTTGGLADRSVQSQVQQETQDALVVSAQDGNLSEAIRNWNTSAETFENASQPGPEGQPTYNTSQFANQSQLGEILDQRFTETGWSYNVELVYENESEFNTTYMVYQGAPPSDALTASYTVTLYENDRLTGADGGTRLRDAESYPIPEADAGDADEPIYNVVEVRLTVW